MIIQVKILNVSDPVRGTSSTTGKAWAQQSVLLGFEDENGDSYLSAQVDEDLWKTLGYRVGDIATLQLKFRTRKFVNGFVANDIRIVQRTAE